jgi:hypothetical protein
MTGLRPTSLAGNSLGHVVSTDDAPVPVHQAHSRGPLDGERVHGVGRKREGAEGRRRG